MKGLPAETKAAIMQLDEVEVRAMLIMTQSWIDGDAQETAAEKAAIYLHSQGRRGQAQAVRDIAKKLAQTETQQ